MRFQPGHAKLGGRVKGSPNKVTVEIRDAARALLEDPAYVRSLKKRLLLGTAGAMEPLLYHYAYGKPPDRHEIAAMTRPFASPLPLTQLASLFTTEELYTLRAAAQKLRTATQRATALPALPGLHRTATLNGDRGSLS